MLKLEYLLKSLPDAQFLERKLPGLWHLDSFPSTPFSRAAKICFKRMALAGLGMRCGDSVPFCRHLR